MSEKISVKIVTPDRTVFEGEADLVVVPGIDGDVGFQPEHISYMCNLANGELRMFHQKQLERYAIHGGFATFRFNALEILTDAAEHAREIDAERALSAKKRAEERISTSGHSVDIDRAEFALKKALTRLNVADVL